MIHYYTYQGHGEIISGQYKGKPAYITNFWKGKAIVCICDNSGISFSVNPKNMSSIFEPYLDYCI